MHLCAPVIHHIYTSKHPIYALNTPLHDRYASREASSNLLVLRGYSTSKDSKPYQEKVPRGKKPGSRRK